MFLIIFSIIDIFPPFEMKTLHLNHSAATINRSINNINKTPRCKIIPLSKKRIRVQVKKSVAHNLSYIELTRKTHPNLYSYYSKNNNKFTSKRIPYPSKQKQHYYPMKNDS
jgi:hypothetical protein